MQRADPAFGACSLDPAGWQITDRNSIDAGGLLGMTAGNQTVDFALGPLSRSRVETWFRKDRGEIAVCRRRVDMDVCEAENRTVEFTRDGGRWLAGDVFTVLCTGDHVRY